MSVKNKTNKNYKRSQKGRSMVEMLGVLAIIGVLSVGGVYGYGIAMKKHKANELLHQASMLATTISAQIQSKGELPTTIENFGDGKYGTFGTPTKANDEQFEMKITGMDSAVCEQVAKMAGGMLRKAECNETTLTLTYNNNLSSEKVAADYNGKQDECEESGNKYCDDDTCISATEECPTGENIDPACVGVTCPEGATCSRGQCQCSNGLFVCGTQCCAEGTYCTGSGTTYTCAVPTGECTKNSDCKDAEGNVDTTKYCDFSDGDYGDCNGLTGGTCTDKGTLTEYTLNLPGGALTVYKGGQMNWWSAVNFCEAHDKKQLVTMSDLGISDSAGRPYCYFDSDIRVEYDEDETYQCNCTGDSGCTTTTTELYQFGTEPTDWLWLADNGKSNSCVVRVLALNFGGVYDDSRYEYYYALCRDP